MLGRSASDGRPLPCVFGVDGVVAVVPAVVAATGVFETEGVMADAVGLGQSGAVGEAGGGRGSACL